MRGVEDISRSLVAVFKPMRHSVQGSAARARLVNKFVSTLNEELTAIDDLDIDAFSTGDGVVVSAGRNEELDRSGISAFINFAIEFTRNVHGSDVDLDGVVNELEIITALNFSYDDRVLPIEDSDYVEGEFIQTEDTIHIAMQMANYCQPGEIIFSKNVIELLQQSGLKNRYDFKNNEPFITKNNREIKTRTYVPSQGEENLYSPDNPSHSYKKYSYFPPVDPYILSEFKKLDLEDELRKVISNTFNSVKELKNTKSFISSSGVLQILMTGVFDDPDDTVYVLSREDREVNFWNQPMKNRYINYLKTLQDSYGGSINQVRFRIYDKSGTPDKKDEEDIMDELKPLHAPGTYFSFPTQSLNAFPKLNDLIFGCTISTKKKFAIIPIPAPEISDGFTRPDLENIGESLERYQDYDVEGAPMKAIITANKDYVGGLIEEMKELEDRDTLRKIK